MGFGWFEFLICLSHNRNVCSLNWKLDENCPPARMDFFSSTPTNIHVDDLVRSCFIFSRSFFGVFRFFFLIYWMLHLKSWRFNLRNYDIHFVFALSSFVYISTINFGGGFLMNPGSFGGSNWDVSRRCLRPPTKYRTNFSRTRKEWEREREWKRAVRCKGGRIWPGTFYHHRQNVCCEWCFVCVSWCR